MKTVYDLERGIYGSVSESRSRRQRKIRRVLRDLGYGVGHGYSYQWDEAALKRLVPMVKKRLGLAGMHSRSGLTFWFW